MSSQQMPLLNALSLICPPRTARTESRIESQDFPYLKKQGLVIGNDAQRTSISPNLISLSISSAKLLISDSEKLVHGFVTSLSFRIEFILLLVL